MFQIGDTIAVLDEDFEGKIIAIKSNIISIETKDGFVLNYFAKELIKINNTNVLNNVTQGFNLSQIIQEKEVAKPNYSQKKINITPERGVPEFDLHIEKLVPNKRGMSNYDILTLQTETAKRHIDFAIRNRIPKIVLIHGIGEGVLKSELDFMIGRYDNITVQEANYQKYGQGAMEIYFKQQK